MKARLILDTKTILADGRIIQRKVWKLPRPTVARTHALKYRLYCGKSGKIIVRYDNETGKGHLYKSKLRRDTALLKKF